VGLIIYNIALIIDLLMVGFLSRLSSVYNLTLSEWVLRPEKK